MRCILRAYRDASPQYLGSLRQELVAPAATLRDVRGTLTESGSAGAGAFEGVWRSCARWHRRRPRFAAIEISAAAADLETGLAEVCKHHQLIVSQLHTEVRLAHGRMKALTAASLDDLARLLPRDQIEDRIAVAAQGTFRHLLLERRHQPAESAHAGQRIPQSRFSPQGVSNDLIDRVYSLHA
jgi:hypothetical protein